MPNNNRDLISAKNAFYFTAGIGLLCVIMKRNHILEKLHRIYNFRNPLAHKRIEIVETLDECQRVVGVLKKHCSTYGVLGFDCEWVTVNGKRRPAALLQLSSHEGLCALFRLCNMKQIPKGLRDLLEDDSVMKVGVACLDDAQKLSFDYGVGVASTLDLRFLATLSGHKGEGLAKLSSNILNVKLDKNWRLSCSDWEAKTLNENQLHYAANDALVAVEIFKKLSKALTTKKFGYFSKFNFAEVQSCLEPFIDVRYKDGYAKNMKGQGGTIQKLPKWQSKKMNSRAFCTKSKIVYDNCLLEAPDGELLCTIDRRKAQWYIDKNLGAEVKTDPFTVRLNFEPAGRAVGEVGRYYQTPKENHCVVCGRSDAYLRKNVVPRDYRRHFPVVMKSHTSHDVLLLCPECHQISNLSDIKIRTKLAELCDAPITGDPSNTKCIKVPELNQLKSAAKALLYNSAKIPQQRLEELKQIVLNHFDNETEISEQLLLEAINTNITCLNENYIQHGEKVVQKYQNELGGLIELEKMWREHFLQTMKPKYLPELWNVNHNANRLEIRAQEGRVESQDLIVAGIK